MENNRVKKQIITTKYYKPYAKKEDYREKANKTAFLQPFLNDRYFLTMYKKISKAQQRDVRHFRKFNELESVYNKVKLQYEV